MDTVAITPDQRFLRNPDLVSADMDGDTVMMSIELGEYYGIGGVGSRIWELLENPISVKEIVQTLCAEFEVEEATCESDLIGFLGRLRNHQLVTEETA